MTDNQDLPIQAADILVVDDTIDSLRMLTEILTQASYEPRPVEDPQMALEAALAQPPDLILLDVMMPKMSGFEVCRRLKQDERTRDVPVIFVSALDALQDQIQGFEAGGVDYISKPFQKAEVLVRVKTHVQLRDTQLHLEELVAERTAEIVESEARYRTLVDQAQDGIVVLQDGKIRFANSYLLELTGYALDELLEAPFEAFLMPDQLPEIVDIYQRRMRGEPAPTVYESAIRHKDGSRIEVEFNAGLTTYDGKSADLVLVRDVRVRVQARQELQAYQHLLGLVTDSVPALVSYVDRQERYRFVNERYEQAYGVPRLQFVGKHVREIIGPEGYAAAKEHIATALAGEAVSYEDAFDYPGIGQRWMRMDYVPDSDDAGEVQGFIAMITDITKRVQAEQALRESEEQYRTLELDPLLELILDHLGRVVDYDSAAIWIREGDNLIIRAGRTPEDAPASVGTRVTVAALTSDATVREMIENLEPVTVADTATHKDLVQELVAVFEPLTQYYERDGASWLGMPVVAKGQLIGIVCLVSEQPGYYTRTIADSVQTLVGRAAIAIENARLHEQVQRTAILDERARLARDLHDAVSQTLFSASLLADTTPRIWEKDQTMARQNLNQLGRLLRGALAEMRTLLFELRPGAIENQTLGQLLGPLAEAAYARSRAKVSLNLEGDRTLPKDVTVALHRIAQESLNNVAKHAEATTVNVNLICGQKSVVLRITDDGRGFDLEKVPAGHHGLSIMRERAQKVGAIFEVESNPGGGTQVVVTWSEQGEREGDD